MSEYTFTIRELQTIARKIGEKIYKEHPDLFQEKESLEFCRTEAISKMNELIKEVEDDNDG